MKLICLILILCSSPLLCFATPPERATRYEIASKREIESIIKGTEYDRYFENLIVIDAQASPLYWPNFNKNEFIKKEDKFYIVPDTVLNKALKMGYKTPFSVNLAISYQNETWYISTSGAYENNRVQYQWPARTIKDAIDYYEFENRDTYVAGQLIHLSHIGPNSISTLSDYIQVFGAVLEVPNTYPIHTDKNTFLIYPNPPLKMYLDFCNALNKNEILLKTAEKMGAKAGTSFTTYYDMRGYAIRGEIRVKSGSLRYQEGGGDHGIYAFIHETPYEYDILPRMREFYKIDKVRELLTPDRFNSIRYHYMHHYHKVEATFMPRFADGAITIETSDSPGDSFNIKTTRRKSSDDFQNTIMIGVGLVFIIAIALHLRRRDTK